MSRLEIVILATIQDRNSYSSYCLDINEVAIACDINEVATVYGINEVATAYGINEVASGENSEIHHCLEKVQ